VLTIGTKARVPGIIVLVTLTCVEVETVADDVLVVAMIVALPILSPVTFMVHDGLARDKTQLFCATVATLVLEEVKLINISSVLPPV
jgi:hypothetical protein